MHKDILLKGLNDGQRLAVLHRDGPMLVTAGPGSGKTHVIITRLLYMIHVYKIPPEKIMVITFTKEAAKSMRSRFLKTYQQDCFVSFGTFHSFYYQIIRSIPKYSKYRLIQEKEKKYILSKVLDYVAPNDIEEKLESLLISISFYKNTEDLEKSSKRTSIEKSELIDIMGKYDREKEKRNVMDFDDMLYLCKKELSRDKNLLKKWKERFQYYLVDEFQDCNPIQYHIIKMLSGKNLFAVGDDDQAIYGFRGADAGIMQRFLKDYHMAEQVVLGINYRCGTQIVRSSSAVISENKMRLSKKLSAQRPMNPEEFVRIKKWTQKSQQQSYFKEIFKDMPKDELPKHAILFRTNQEMQVFAAEFAKYNIPFQMKDKSRSIYDHFIVKDIITYLQAAEGKRERKLFLRILNKPRGQVGREALEEEMVDFEKLKKFYNNPFMNNPEAVREIEMLELHLQQLKKIPLYLTVRYICKACGYEKYLYNRSEGNEQMMEKWLEFINWLEEDMRRFSNLSQWLEYQKEYEIKVLKSSTEDEKTSSNSKSWGVHMMTMHASKGLEFEHCYILNVNDGMIPKYQKGQKLTQEELEEERRIFYVGMTRAQKTLELHCLTGTKERPKFPSRFIKSISDYSASSMISSNSHLSRYSSNASATASYSSSSSM